MSIDLGNDRLITVHAPFLALTLNQNAILARPLHDGWIHNVRTIVVECVGLSFGKGRKGNQTWLAISQKC